MSQRSAGRRAVREGAGRVAARPPLALPGRRRTLHNRHGAVLGLVLADVGLALVVWALALLARNVVTAHSEFSSSILATAVLSATVWVVLRWVTGLYPGYGLDLVHELRRQTYGTLAAVAIIVSTAFMLQVGDLVSRLMFFLGFLGLLVAAPFARYLMKVSLRRLGLWGKPVMVLGATAAGESLIRTLREEWQLGYRPIAVFDEDAAPEGGYVGDVPYAGTLADAGRLAYPTGANTLMVAMPGAERGRVAELVDRASRVFRHVIFLPDLTGVANAASEARDFGGTFGVEVKHNLLVPGARLTKRSCELAVTVAGGLLVLPVIGVVALLVRMESGGTAFYRDYRLGKDGGLFSCLKFRTMKEGAEEKLVMLLQENPELYEEYRKYHKLRDDPRVTRVGRLLRKTSLDELPQLWNVLRGEMSLVGPRPYLPRESAEIGAHQSAILRVYPGMTGLWQCGKRNDSTFDERVSMDAYYVRNWSVWLDLVILARTVKSVLRGRGAL